MSLAPAFDPQAPLGLTEDTTSSPGADPVRPATAVPPRAADVSQVPPATGDPTAPDDRSGAREGYEAAVRAAVLRARGYPGLARERGLAGSVRVGIMLGRQGRLLTARLVRSSGSRTLDDAALAAVRDARYPAAPPELSTDRVSLEFDIAFNMQDH